MYQLDELFFRPSPPTTPTSRQAPFSSRSELHNDDDNLNHQSLISDESPTSSIEESLRESSGVWNHYHVDRPPDLLSPADQQSDLQLTRERSADTQVTRGPTVNVQVRLDGQVESTAPISAACKPDIRQTVKPITQEEKGEVIWPLDQVIL